MGKLLISTLMVAIMYSAFALDNDVIRDRIRADLINKPVKSETELKNWISAQYPDGSWSDIDYQDQNRSLWATSRHLSRLYDLALAWVKPNQAFYQEPTIVPVVQKAAEYWVEHRFRNPNWWYNEICVPELMTNILVIVPELFSDSELRRNMLEVAHQVDFGRTGQNRVWQAKIVLKRALVENDEPTVKRAIEEILSELRLSDSEGIREDGCFHQHGPQVQFGNYGLAFLNDMVYWNQILAGTKLAFNEEQMGLLRNLVLNGYRWVLWKDRFDLLAQGRQLGKGSQQGKATSALRCIAKLRKTDPGHDVAYAKIFDKEHPFVGNHHFWKSDYMVHRRPNWYASVRMNSVRTAPMEDRVNWDNALGRYLADGVMLVMCSGDEYLDVAPCWNWTRLPGTTLPDTPILNEEECRKLNIFVAKDTPARFTLSRKWRTRGESKFTGGVTDGTRGVAIYSQELDGVKAKKAYFFDYNAIYALGCDIDSTSPYPVATTIESCLKQGEVTSGDGWFHHHGIGYRGMGMNDCSGFRDGDWRYISGGIKKPDPVRKELFSLQIDHGTGCHGASYSYAILPGATANETANWSGGKVLSNTPELQAIELSDNTIAAVFHQPGKLGDFTAEQAGLYLIERGRVLYSDPTKGEMTVELPRCK